MPDTEHPPTHVETQIRFAMATQPYEHSLPRDDTVGHIRREAIDFFKITETPGDTYYLEHDGVRLADSETIGAVAGEHHEIRLLLIKVLVQG